MTLRRLFNSRPNRRSGMGLAAAAAAAALLCGCDFAHTLPDAPRSLTGPTLRPPSTSQPVTPPQSVAQAPRSSGVVIVDRRPPAPQGAAPPAPVEPSPFAYETFQGYQSPAAQAAAQAAQVAPPPTPTPTVVAAGPVSGAQIGGADVEYVDMAALNSAPPAPYGSSNVGQAAGGQAYEQTYESSVGAAPVYEPAPPVVSAYGGGSEAYQSTYNPSPLYDPQPYDQTSGGGAYEISVQDAPSFTAAPAESYAPPVAGPVYVEADPAPSAPAYDAPTYNEPIYNEPTYEEPTYEEAPSYAAPTYAAPEPEYAAPTYVDPAPSATASADLTAQLYEYVDAGAAGPQFDPAPPITSESVIGGGVSANGGAPLEIIASADYPPAAPSGAAAPSCADSLRFDASAQTASQPPAQPSLQTLQTGDAAPQSVALADGSRLTLVALNGAPRRQSDALGRRLISKLGAASRGVERKLEGLAILSNRKITIYWRVIDSEGAALKTHVSSVGVSSADWSAVASADLEALAEDAAQWLRGAFDGAGAVSVAGAPPLAAPAPMIAQPQPVSAQPISVQPVFTGPRPPRRRPARPRAEPLRRIDVAAAPAPRVSAGGGASQSAAASVSPAPRPSAQTQPPTSQPSLAGPRPIFFRGVFGAPGDGDRALANEVRKILDSNGVRTTTMQTNDALYLSAQVAKTPGSSTDSIRIVWSVKDSFGREYGQVMQENNVPRGSLDGSWGRDAYYAAMGAREGILQLVALGAEG